MLHAHAEWLEAAQVEEREIGAGIYLGDSSCVGRVKEEQEARFRMFTSYAGWGPDQLEQELTAGAWAVVPATPELLFDTPAENLWARLLPPTIPQPSVN